MSQFPGFMPSSPTSTMAASSFLHLSAWPPPVNEDLLLANEEAELEEKIRIRAYAAQIPLKLPKIGFQVIGHVSAEGNECNTLVGDEYGAILEEIRTANNALPILGRSTITNDPDDVDGEPEDDDADNGEESEADEFTQETA